VIRRLRGLFVIVRALLPILLVIGLAVATWLTARAVVDSTQEYGRRLSTQLEGIQAAVDEANQGLAAMTGFVTASVDAAEDLFGRVADLRDSVTIPLPELAIPEFEIPVIDVTIALPELDFGGDLNIPIPGVEPLKNLAGDLAEAGRKVTDPIVKVAALADVPPHLEEAARDTADYADAVRSSMGTWMAVILAMLAAGAAIWLGSAVRPITGEISRGWSMLAGHPVPEKAVRDLAGRVKELERKVARLTG
jgi:hypothetical protein